MTKSQDVRTKNVVANTLSRLPCDTEEMLRFECFTNDEIEDFSDFDLLQLPKIVECQKQNAKSMKKHSTRRESCGTVLLHVYNDKIVIPMKSKVLLMKWYHGRLINAVAGRIL